MGELLRNGADAGAADDAGNPALVLAVAARCPSEVLSALLRAGADPDAAGPRGSPLALAVANAHYVWQTNDGKETVISFSEAAGVPGNKHVLQAIAPILSGAVTPLDNSTQRLEFAERDGEATGVLAAPLPGGAAAVEAAAPYGQFKVGDDLVDLKYYTSASVASKPNDWFAIQDALKNELEVTIRDPYQATPVVPYDVGVEDKARAGDQCPHGSPTVDGDACVSKPLGVGATLVAKEIAAAQHDHCGG